MRIGHSVNPQIFLPTCSINKIMHSAQNEMDYFDMPIKLQESKAFSRVVKQNIKHKSWLLMKLEMN